MGEVYRAHDSRLGRDVALKTLPARFAADAERVARFEREARILATLNHPDIATIHGFERQDGMLALVMELVEGETTSTSSRAGTSHGRSAAGAGRADVTDSGAGLKYFARRAHI